MKKVILLLNLFLVFACSSSSDGIYVEYTYDEKGRIKTIECSKKDCIIDINTDTYIDITNAPSTIKAKTVSISKSRKRLRKR